MKMALTVRGISKSYPRHGLVLHGVDLTLATGEVVALLGKSGAGKSTLLRGLCGLEDMNSGEAWLDDWHYLGSGRALVPSWQIARRVGMVFQTFNLFQTMPVWRNITLALERVMEVPRAEALVLANRVATTLGIESILRKYPSEISGGQAQRVALARAIVLRPKVLALDEVTAALDPVTVDVMTDALAKIRTVEGTVDTSSPSSIMLVTHAIRFAESFSDRILFLHEGRIIENLPARQFRTSTQPAVVEYLKHVT